MKQCTICKEDKELEEYYAHPKVKQGRHSVCIPCFKERAKQKSYNKDLTVKSKTCRVCDKEKDISNFSAHRRRKDGYTSECTECSRIRQYKQNYGITIKEYERMLVEQDHSCYTCGSHESNLEKRLHVDHEHSTGRVRGLLCDRCNRALGMFQDDEVLLYRAIEYLNK
jgi:hypothetical protein